MTIYELSNEFLQLQAQLEELMYDENGDWKDYEDTPEIYERYMQSAMDLTEKLDNTVAYIKDLQADRDAISREIATLQERKQQKTGMINRMEDLLDYAMRTLNKDNFETGRSKVSYRKSTAVKVLDESEFMARPENRIYLKYSDPTISKSEVMKALKAGKEVPGAALIEKKNIQIK